MLGEQGIIPRGSAPTDGLAPGDSYGPQGLLYIWVMAADPRSGLARSPASGAPCSAAQ